MKKIQLTKGMFTLVDEEDYDMLNKHRWWACNGNGIWYAGRTARDVNGKRITILVHREIMNVPLGMEIDHRNRDGLDNRRCNLRICSHSQNQKNRKIQKNNKSGLVGVSWNKQHKKWEACVHNGKSIHLGLFDDKIEAAHAVDKKAKEFFGEYAVLNFPEESMPTRGFTYVEDE